MAVLANKMLECDRVQANAYRLLRLSCDSTFSQIHNSEASIRRYAILGLTEMTENDLPALGTVVRTEASIRAATGLLAHPVLRMEARLFWFHGSASLSAAASNQGTASTASRAAPLTAHDDALRALIVAYTAEQTDTNKIAFALRQWHTFVSQAEYWRLIPILEKQGRFEPPAITAEIEALRLRAMALAAEPFERAARAAWARKELKEVRPYLAIFKDLHETGEWAEQSRENLLSPIRESLTDACRTLAEKYRIQIVREDNAAKQNQAVCHVALRYYRDFVEPAWHNLQTALAEEDGDVRLARCDVADCLTGIAIDHTWADEQILAEDLATEALTLARGTIVEVRLTESLRGLVDNAEKRKDRAHKDATTAIRKALDVLEANFSGRIIAPGNGTELNRLISAEGLLFYRERIEPTLKDLVDKTSVDAEGWRAWREETAERLSKIATDFARAHEFSFAEELAREAISLAQGTKTATRTQQGLVSIQEAGERQRQQSATEAEADLAREQVHVHCSVIASTFSHRIVKKEGFSQQNRLVCSDELHYFRAQVEPALQHAVQLTRPGDTLLLKIHEQAALCLSNIAGDHAWADDFTGAERLLEEALALLSQDSALANTIKEGLRKIREAAEKRRERNERLSEVDLAVKQVHYHCGVIASSFSNRIIAKEGFSQHNSVVCRDELQYFRAQITPALEKAVQLLAPGDPLVVKLYEHAGSCLSNIASDHTWADDSDSAERLLEEALAFTRDAEVAHTLRSRYLKVRRFPAGQNLDGVLAPIAIPPSLKRVKGTGFGLYGLADFDKVSNSYATTRYFTLAFLPVFPLGRYRVSRDWHAFGKYRFLSSMPLRFRERCLRIFLVLLPFVIMAALAYARSSGGSSGAGLMTVAVSPGPVSSNSESIPDAAPSAEAGPAPALPAVTYPPADSEPAADLAVNQAKRPSALHALIDSEKDEAEMLETQRRLLQQEIWSAPRDGNVQVASNATGYTVDAFNRVTLHRRELILRINANIRAYNKMVDDPESLIEEYMPNGGSAQ